MGTWNCGLFQTEVIRDAERREQDLKQTLYNGHSPKL